MGFVVDCWGCLISVGVGGGVVGCWWFGVVLGCWVGYVNIVGVVGVYYCNLCCWFGLLCDGCVGVVIIYWFWWVFWLIVGLDCGCRCYWCNGFWFVFVGFDVWLVYVLVGLCVFWIG